jgi:hypothetical protein
VSGRRPDLWRCLQEETREDDGLSKYEKERLERITANERTLREAEMHMSSKKSKLCFDKAAGGAAVDPNTVREGIAVRVLYEDSGWLNAAGIFEEGVVHSVEIR